ncbi:Heavy metal-associated isoprenylated plant protein 17 [Cardamine amara subsp. amara]|uniref:Heavy metal-associated isoprenylated plant protein 17 n=1 Tax=Cardamine amara subsp. amara TaxID=228776 RepID=A0ABD1ARR1_CARAN
MMGCWPKQSLRENVDNVIVTEAELKIGMYCERFAKKIRKVSCQFEGVEACITDMNSQKVMVSGNFNLGKLVKTLKNKTGKKIEILMKKEKSDMVQKEGHEHEIVPPETRIIKVEFDIPFLCEEYKKSYGKVIKKCEGVITYVADVENKKVVVVGNFDKEELLRKLNKKIKMHQKIMKAEKERKDREECKIAAEIREEIDKDRNIYLQPNTDYEKEMAKYYMLSDENPKGYSIS